MMKITYYPRPALLGWLVLVLALLVGGACVPQRYGGQSAGDGGGGGGRGCSDSVAGGADGDWGTGEFQGSGRVAMALADYGPIEGHRVSMGAGLDSLRTAAGGAENILTPFDPRRAAEGHGEHLKPFDPRRAAKGHEEHL